MTVCPRRGRHVIVSLLAVVVAVATLAVVRVPGASGGFIGRVTATENKTATAPYFTCTAGARGTDAGDRATFSYPLGDTGTTIADVSGNGANGAARGGVSPATAVGLTKSGHAPCSRDNTKVSNFNGVDGYVTGPSSLLQAPTTVSQQVWFRATPGNGGALLGYGNLSSTTTLLTRGRDVFVDRSGHLVYVPTSGGPAIVSSASYDDSVWHQVVATLAPTPNGFPASTATLYVDGVAVGTNPAINLQGVSLLGSWHIGAELLDGLLTTLPAPRNYFTGSMAFATVYPYALSADQVSAQYLAGA